MNHRTARRSTSSTRSTRRSSTSTRATSTARKGYGKGRARYVQPVPPAPDTLELGKFALDTANKGNGITLLRTLPDNAVKTAFFDPQYPSGVDWKKERSRKSSVQKRRAELNQMSEDTIARFFRQLSRVIAPSGHVFLWVDNYHARNGITHWVANTDFVVVDKIVWAKGMATAEGGVVRGSGKMGLGDRARRSSEELFVLQKVPTRAKDCWKRKNIRDVWMEKVNAKSHVHAKPMELQKALIEATTEPGDLVLDPCAGSFSVMDAALETGRRFIGCDLDGAKRRPIAVEAQKRAKPARAAKKGVATTRRAKAKSVETVEVVVAKPARSTVARVKPAAKPKRASVRKVSRASTATPAVRTKRAAPAKPTATRKPARKAVRKPPRARKVPRDPLAGGSFVLVAMPANVLNMLAANEALWALPGTKRGRHPRAQARVLAVAA